MKQKLAYTLTLLGIIFILGLIGVIAQAVNYNFRNTWNITNVPYFNGTTIELNGDIFVNGTSLGSGSSGDITAVTTSSTPYLSGGATSGAVDLDFDESKLNDTIDARTTSTTDTNTNVTGVSVSVGTTSLQNTINITQDSQLDVSGSWNQYDLNITTDSGTSVIYDYEALAISGGSGVTTSSSGNTVTVTASGNSTEQIEDVAGAMVSGNTESGITVTYQDGDGTIDFTVNVVDSNASTICSGSTTYLDGEGNCDDISSVYSANTFQTISSDGTSHSADSLTDTFTLNNGTGIRFEQGTDTVTISAIGNSSTEIQTVSVGGEASGTVGSITLGNSALDDQYLEQDADNSLGGSLYMNGNNVTEVFKLILNNTAGASCPVLWVNASGCFLMEACDGSGFASGGGC